MVEEVEEKEQRKTLLIMNKLSLNLILINLILFNFI